MVVSRWLLTGHHLHRSKANERLFPYFSMHSLIIIIIIYCLKYFYLFSMIRTVTFRVNYRVLQHYLFRILKRQKMCDLQSLVFINTQKHEDNLQAKKMNGRKRNFYSYLSAIYWESNGEITGIESLDYWRLRVHEKL